MKSLPSCLVLAAAVAPAVPVAAILGASTIRIPNVLQTGPTAMERTSTGRNFDGQKISPGPNVTTADWWYFDAISTTSNESINIVFLESGPATDLLGGLPVLQLLVSGSFANGSLFSYDVPVDDDGFAVIRTGADGTSITGDWTGSGFTFHGSSIIPGVVRGPYTYTVRIDCASTIGVTGTLQLVGVAPAHYPCGPATAGQTEQVAPGILWNNAVPDSVATAHFVIGGQPFLWEGRGYHDHNWIDQPLYPAVQSWLWGHATVGPYSVVWFDSRTLAGVEYRSGYVAKDGIIVEASCTDTSAIARPWGDGAAGVYPPDITSPAPAGMLATFSLGAGRQLVVNVTTDLILDENPVYVRALGKATGTLSGVLGGDRVFYGKSLWDEFKFPQ